MRISCNILQSTDLSIGLPALDLFCSNSQFNWFFPGGVNPAELGVTEYSEGSSTVGGCGSLRLSPNLTEIHRRWHRRSDESKHGTTGRGQSSQSDLRATSARLVKGFFPRASGNSAGVCFHLVVARFV